MLESGKTNEILLTIPSENQLQVVVKSGSIGPYDSVPIRGAEISTEPETVTLITDDEGRADFGIVPFRPYGFQIKKYNVVQRHEEYEYGNIVIRNGTLENRENEINLSKRQLRNPEIDIISPVDNHYQRNNNINLICDGYDFEDDILPDSAFIWYSDIDGELGTGKELYIDRLSVGNHLITLVGTDSHHMQTEKTIHLKLSFFDDDSYFPLPYTGYWYYRYEPSDFTVADDIRGVEHWSLDELRVSAKDVDTRNSSLNYTITRGDTTKYYQYEIIDHYVTDSENIYITKTSEQLRIFDDEAMNTVPTEQLDIETKYTPQHLLVKQYIDVNAQSSYEIFGAAEVTWEYRNVNSYTQTHLETIDINTSYELGTTESVNTSLGSYDAIPLTILSEGTERIWWLVKGIGIVRLAYDSFGFPLTAELYETNMSSLSGQSAAGRILKTSYGRNSLRKILNAPPETPERMLELSRILRGLCPR
ncbi:hypothetical protein ACFL6P_00135 [Candidatus Latescibacterota bacterium]